MDAAWRARPIGGANPAAPPAAAKRRWRGPPLALQILGLLIGGLVVAQLVTLLLTMLLPPAPAAQYALDDIAAALHDGQTGSVDHGLQRIVQDGPPDIAGPGWLVSERSRADLARMLGARPQDVGLAFYTPLPFAGVAAAPSIALKADDGPLRPLAALSLDAEEPRGGLLLAQYVPPPGAGPLPRSVPPRGEPRFGTLPHDALPPGIGAQHSQPGDPMPGRLPPVGRLKDRRGGEGIGRTGTFSTRGVSAGLYSIDPTPPEGATGRGTYIPGDGGAAVPPLLRGTPPAAERAAGAASAPSSATRPTVAAGTEAEGLANPGFRGRPPFDAPGAMPPSVRQPPLVPALETPITTPLAAPPPPIVAPPLEVRTAPPAGAAPAEPLRIAPAAEPVVPPLLAAPPLPARAADPVPLPSLPSEAPAGPPIPVTAPARSLFGLAPAPFVEGDFVASLRLANGRWAVVQPAPEPFPNAWQRRLILWFVIAFAIVAPLGWLFARRLSKPLGQFAAAAERLGRDPAAAVIAVDGPAEIGRAAHAFNLMQTRLRSFVDDRTAMIGAISHDLRTPLTRMRFRIEDVPDDVREGLLEEVAEMEAMITSVLEFIRDASAPGLRERLDLKTLVDDVVEDAAMIGNDVAIEDAQSATVDIDVLGMRRVLDNLLENAVKYGARARVRLRTDAQNAVAEIIDDGPGLPDEELERVFEPFYRSEAARSSDKAGSGLGLAVCRSIARAHGGDVRLLRSTEGFLAQVRVPLAYGAERQRAA